MKRLIFKYFMVFGVLLSASSIAQNYNMTKSFDQSYALTKNMEVSIINKYGDIQVVHWDQDSVRISVMVEVNSHKESKAVKLFESIDVNFRDNQFYIVAETEILGKSSVWTDISDATKQIFNAKTVSRIDYTIYIPNSAHLILKNKYGNIYLGDYHGDLDIELANGDVKAHDLLGKTKINVSFGDLYINKIEHAFIQSTSAEAEIQEVAYLETKSRSSKLFIDQIEELNMNSSHDKYHLGSLQNIHGKGYFTYLKINDLSYEVDIDQKFGSLHFKEIGQEVERFNLKTYKSDIHLNLKYEEAYLLDFTTKNPPVIQYPTGEYKQSEVVINEEDETKNIKISWGDENSQRLLPIHIQAEEGKVFINVK